MKVFLIRHGATDKNLNLSEEGLKESERLSEFFNTRPVDLIYCSPIKRTLETAHIIFPDQKMMIENRLAPSCNSLSLLQEVQEFKTVFISHQPNIEQILSYLGFENLTISTGSCFYYDGKNIERVGSFR
jgi:phosphohistidine phosphatase SixA